TTWQFSRSISTLTTLDDSKSLPPYRGAGHGNTFCILTSILCGVKDVCQSTENPVFISVYLLSGRSILYVQ
ncbi:MAG: hypothetical protein PUD38_08400, partial [Firmicutes bacterium]|nr:hypothetical protein [Bacillota bacterium]